MTNQNQNRHQAHVSNRRSGGNSVTSALSDDYRGEVTVWADVADAVLEQAPVTDVSRHCKCDCFLEIVL